MAAVLKMMIKDPEINRIRIATGYWDIPGLVLVEPQLRCFFQRPGARLELLLGLDPYVYAGMLETTTLPKDARYPHDFIRIGLNELADNIKEPYRDAISLLLEYCEGENPPFEIRLYDVLRDGEKQFMHSKCYIFSHLEGDEFDEYPAYALTGSSNFTKQGLTGNAELNYLENNYATVALKAVKTPPREFPRKGHIAWFTEKWEQSRPWTKEFLEQLLWPSAIGGRARAYKPSKQATNAPELTPYEMYIKVLQDEFGHRLSTDSDIVRSYLPKHYKAFNYQTDAVLQCYKTMMQHGGFLLADVVGLGKTVMTALVIRHFLAMHREKPNRHVLVVCPPAVEESWKATLKDFDTDKQDPLAPWVHYVTTGKVESLAQVAEDALWSEIEGETWVTHIGLVVVDESHKFRNEHTKMYKALAFVIRNAGKPYVALLSATPQNNSPSDLKNQLYLFQHERKASSLKKAFGGNLDNYFTEKEKRYRELRQNAENYSPEEFRHQLRALNSDIRDCILNDIMIRRTRSDVAKYYAEEMQAKGLRFPKVSDPQRMVYQMSPEWQELFRDTIKLIAGAEEESGVLGYYRYRYIEYLCLPEDREKYRGIATRTVTEQSRQLANIMRMSLVKRLESSLDAFRASLRNLLQYTRNMIRMWNDNAIFIAPDLNVNAELKGSVDETGSFEAGYKKLRDGIARLNQDGRNDDERNKEYHQNDFYPTYLSLLREDEDLLQKLCARWDAVTSDPKLEGFRKALPSLLDNHQLNPTGKLVIFSESRHTVESLAKVLEETKPEAKALVVTADNRDKIENEIRYNFDANCPKEQQKNDYQVIVTTDVLAEGVNLHRANCILNYDVPWNATRMMQRIGRVNRIGSEAEEIHVFNCTPPDEVDHQLRLVSTAYTKLQSFHTLFGEDARVFSDEEEVVQYELSLPEEEEESPTERFLYELKVYREAHPARYDFLANAKRKPVAVSASQGEGVFMLSRGEIRFYVAVEKGGVRDISNIEFLERVKTAPDERRVAVPLEAENLRKRAEDHIKENLDTFADASPLHPASKKEQGKAVSLLNLKLQEYDNELSDEAKDAAQNVYSAIIDGGNTPLAQNVVKLAQKKELTVQMLNNQLLLWGNAYAPKLNEPDVETRFSFYY